MKEIKVPEGEDFPQQQHRDGLRKLLQANRDWAADMRQRDPDFFNRLVKQQTPEYLWIGCSDSRVPANQILGLQPGEVFVQRNVGNQAMHTDMNLMSCLEYAVKSLKVKTIIVCGHYNCGAVKAALQLPHTTPSLVNCWISDIRDCRNQAEQELQQLDAEQQLARLCELNVLRQCFKVATSPIVASAWAEGQELHLYGLIYNLADGHLKKLAGPISSDNGPLAEVSKAGQAVAAAAEDQTTAAFCIKSTGSDGISCTSPLSATFSDFLSRVNNITLATSLAKHKTAYWDGTNSSPADAAGTADGDCTGSCNCSV